MRVAACLAVAAMLLAGGCSKEPSFNEAYEERAADLEAKAANMQAELSNQLNAATLPAEHDNGARP